MAFNRLSFSVAALLLHIMTCKMSGHCLGPVLMSITSMFIKHLSVEGSPDLSSTKEKGLATRDYQEIESNWWRWYMPPFHNQECAIEFKQRTLKHLRYCICT